MLGLRLRNEFQGQLLKGTAIELSNSGKTGATQIAAADFLKITYPTADVVTALESIEPERGLPVVLMGERGQGKSHLMAVLYHALSDQQATRSWLESWTERLDDPRTRRLTLRDGLFVIEENMQRQSYKYLWDLLFERHPEGQYARGVWDSKGGQKTSIPPEDMLLDIFAKRPTALILDEFQTWFDGLVDKQKEEDLPRQWAFSFIQTLSGIAKTRPDLLLFVVSVRNNDTESFQQIHRDHPLVIDFSGPNAKRDRQRLLLHRLFENREQISETDIARTVKPHVDEFFRLRGVLQPEQSRARDEFTACWPFSPHLLTLLEDQILLATKTQQTRDLIRILADLFKRRGEESAVFTAADFRIDDPDSCVALINSMANAYHEKLREKALRNLEAVQEAENNWKNGMPNLSGILSSLWLHSLAETNQAGADAATLQIDVTQQHKIDDNAFQVELGAIVGNSFNIHEQGGRYLFKEEENPQAKLISHARNPRLFKENEDQWQLAGETRYVLAGQNYDQNYFHIVVLPRNWENDPWERVFHDKDNPKLWDNRIPFIVLPEPPSKPHAQLGKWLRYNLTERRNAVRFLLPPEKTANIFADNDLLILARCVYLADKWRGQSPEYTKLHRKYQKDLRERLETRFSRFAILRNWNYPQPENCRFAIEAHKAKGDKIPDAVDSRIENDLFEPEAFERYTVESAQRNESLARILKDLKEPLPNSEDCIPWLGEGKMKEKIYRLCAKGKFAIDLGGARMIQPEAGDTEKTVFDRISRERGPGKRDEDIILCPIQHVPGTASVPSSPEDVSVTVMPSPGPTSVPYTVGGTSIYPDAMPKPPHPQGTLFSGMPSPEAAHLSLPATSALNLLAMLEKNGVGSGSRLRNMMLRVDALDFDQLRRLLMQLPDNGLHYGLDVDKEP